MTSMRAHNQTEFLPCIYNKQIVTKAELKGLVALPYWKKRIPGGPDGGFMHERRFK